MSLAGGLVLPASDNSRPTLRLGGNFAPLRLHPASWVTTNLHFAWPNHPALRRLDIRLRTSHQTRTSRRNAITEAYMIGSRGQDLTSSR